MTRYTENDLTTITYGEGKNKKFIIYTDWNNIDGYYMKRVYPDIETNKSLAIQQALRWLNSTDSKKYNISVGPSKIYVGYSSPFKNYCETDWSGISLEY